MADNITLNNGSGGASLATDDVGGVQYQRVKMAFGTDGAATDVSASAGLPSDPLDRALRDCGKVDVATLDQYTPVDVDTVGTLNALPVVLKVEGSGGPSITGDAANGLDVDVTRLPALVAGTANIGDVDVASIAAGDNNIGNVDLASAIPAGDNNIGNVDVVTVPADPFGANADAIVAAGAVGSISAKLRRVTQGLEDLKTGVVLAAGTAAIGKLAANDGVDIGNVDVATVPADPFGANADAASASGSISAKLREIATNGVVLKAGTAAIGKLTANTGVTIGAVEIAASQSVAVTQATAANLNAQAVGPAAHDAAISGNPLRLAGRALTADYTAVAAGDTADLITTVGGKLVTHPYALPENYVSGTNATAMTDTTSTSIVASAGAGLRNYITHIIAQNSHATVGTWVKIQDGSGGTTLYQIYCPATGGGASVPLPCPIKTTAATALYAACVTTGANVFVSASGYKAP